MSLLQTTRKEIAGEMLRGMPRSNDAEEGVLTCCFHGPDVISHASTNLPPEAFYHHANRMIFEEMLSFVSSSGKPLDLVTLSTHFLDRQLMDKIGGPAKLAELYGQILTPAHYTYYRDILLDKLLLRRTITSLTSGIQRCYEHEEDVQEAVASICSDVLDAIKPDLSKGHKTFRTHIAEYLDLWQQRMSGEVEAGIPTRWDSFNATFGGVTPCYWLVTAYPSEGKSSLAQNLMEDVLAHGKHAVWYSYEMNTTECLDRLMVARSRINSDKVFRPRDNKPDHEEARAIKRAVTEMNEWGMHLRCEPGWTIEQVEGDVKALCAKHDIGLVVIDYIQLVPTRKTYSSRAEQVAHVSRLIKSRISGGNNVAVLVLSQLNDDGKTLDSRAPNQDASNAMSIEPGKGLLVAKNRNGRRGHHLLLELNGPTFSFQPFTPEPKPEKPTKKHREYHKD